MAKWNPDEHRPPDSAEYDHLLTRPGGGAQRRNLGEQVAAHVRGLIFTGDLRPRQRVPQDELAALLGVSRLPVREALIALEGEGLVDIQLHRGAFVAAITRRDISDHYVMYGMLHGLAAKRAAVLADDALLDRLTELHDRMHRTSADRLGDLNWEFHRQINLAGGSLRLSAVLRSLVRSIPSNFFDVVEEADTAADVAHAHILDAVRLGDGPAAEAACVGHLREEGELVVRALERRGFWRGDKS